MGNGRLFCFGLGYTAEVLARRLLARGWLVAGTSRDVTRLARLAEVGIEGYVFHGGCRLPYEALAACTHLLISIPPDDIGDVVLSLHLGDLLGLPNLVWVGLLSTTGIYGDRAGAWVDETVRPSPENERSRRRLRQEQLWQASGLLLRVFRLPGIYGPGRSAIDDVRAGRARRIDKPGQVFSRIHVEDIAGAIEAAMQRSEPGGIYNIADDLPAASHEVVYWACQLLNVPPPPIIPFEGAPLSPMAASFYNENRRVANRRMKRDLGYSLVYPTYREGLAAIAGISPLP